jgi:hypothetical protein
MDFMASEGILSISPAFPFLSCLIATTTSFPVISHTLVFKIGPLSILGGFIRGPDLVPPENVLSIF